MNQYPKESVWLAALLHDLGKFRQRTATDATTTHQEQSRLFVAKTFSNYFKPLNHDLEQAIALHHSADLTSRLQKLIVLADRLSMRELPTETQNPLSPPWEPLSALLTCQPLAPSPKTRKKISLQSLPLQSDDIFPSDLGPDNAADYATLWDQFEAEFSRFVDGREFEPGDIGTLLSLLHKFTSCMPAQTVPFQQNPKSEEHPLDVSLYHHLKTTAAIAACLDQQLEDHEIDALLQKEKTMTQRPLCALVKGDISGTQDFLYLLTSDGAARGLRARSFYLQLLTETIANWVLRQIELSETNLLFAGGGHFYVLLPFTKTKDGIDAWRKEISEKLWAAHRGDLYLNLGLAEISYDDLIESEDKGESKFAEKWSQATADVSARKQRKWLEIAEQMQSDLFSAQEIGGTDSVCDVCRFEGEIVVDDENGTAKCQRCRAFELLGRDLRNPQFMVTITHKDKDVPTNSTWKNTLAAFGVEIRVGPPKKKEHLDGKNATLWIFDSPEIWPDAGQISQSIGIALQYYHWDEPPRHRCFLLLAAATPSKWDEKEHDHVVAEFSDLAQASEGAKWLGALRMDVDSLGDIFRNRLGKKANITRMSTLSESLRLFFESRVPELCRKENPYSDTNRSAKDTLFLLYAGGDDLFVAGAWSKLPILARKIHDEFRDLVGGDHITLSAGIAIEHEKYPLYQLANDAKHALDDRAKEYKRENNGHEKDAICFLQTTVGWEHFNDIERWQDTLFKMIEAESSQPKLPRGFLLRLGEIHSMFAENRKLRLQLDRSGGDLKKIEEMIYYERWRWHLSYQLNKVIERYSNHAPKITELQKEIIDKKLIDNLNVIARWTELLTRKE